MPTDEEEEKKQNLRQVLSDQRHHLQLLRMAFENNVEIEIELAKRMKAKHDALISVGFTEGQAMQIILTRGLQP